LSALTKAKAISCSSLSPLRRYHDLLVASNVTSASAVCSSSTNAPHEYFDHSGSGGIAFAALLPKTQQIAVTGQYELFKVSSHFDGTARHPDWLGGDDPAVQKLARQLPG